MMDYDAIDVTCHSIKHVRLRCVNNEISVSEIIHHLQKLLKKLSQFLHSHLAEQIIGDASASLSILNKDFLSLIKEFNEIKFHKTKHDISLELTRYILNVHINHTLSYYISYTSKAYKQVAH